MKLSFEIVKNEPGNLEVYSRRDLNLFYKIIFICIVGISLIAAIWLVYTNASPMSLLLIISSLFPLYLLYSSKKVEVIKVTGNKLLLEEINRSGHLIRSFNSSQIEKMTSTFDTKRDLPIGELTMTQYNLAKGRITLFLADGATVQFASLINYEHSLKLIKLIQDALNTAR